MRATEFENEGFHFAPKGRTLRQTGYRGGRFLVAELVHLGGGIAVRRMIASPDNSCGLQEAERLHSKRRLRLAFQPFNGPIPLPLEWRGGQSGELVIRLAHRRPRVNSCALQE